MTRGEHQADQADHGEAEAPEHVDHPVLAAGHPDRERHQDHGDRRDQCRSEINQEWADLRHP